MPAIKLSDRIYAVGDVHGRLDLFADLIRRIRRDAEARGPCRTQIVLLGGVVNHGSQSAALVRQLRCLSGKARDLVILKGSDEQIMLDALAGDLDMLEAWLCLGGDKALKSWGLDDEVIHGPLPALLAAARAAIDEADIAWLARRPLYHRAGNFLFVHAGIRPGVPIDQQDEEDLLWITTDFVESDDDHEAVVVHGHTPSGEEPALLKNRIGVNTAAYRTGRLAAVGLEGDHRWVIST